MTTPENPPAFPIVCEQYKEIEYHGMDLRDYFAAKAMQALLSINYAGSDAAQVQAIWNGIPRQAFITADAMLKERSK